MLPDAAIDFRGVMAARRREEFHAAFNRTAFSDPAFGGSVFDGSALDGLLALKQELNAPRALADYGFTEDAIAAAAEAILPSVPPSNPRPVTAEDLRALLRAAWSGADPKTAF